VSVDVVVVVVLPVEVVADVVVVSDEVADEDVALVWLEVALEVVVAELVDAAWVVVELVMVGPLAVTAICACSPLPSTVTMYFCPATTP